MVLCQSSPPLINNSAISFFFEPARLRSAERFSETSQKFWRPISKRQFEIKQPMKPFLHFSPVGKWVGGYTYARRAILA